MTMEMEGRLGGVVAAKPLRQAALLWLQSLGLLALRVALAVPFYRSGLTKWDGFLSLSPSTPWLFENQFKLHVLGGEYPFPYPDLMAHLSAIGEIVFPVLLVLGLATRFAALGTLAMAAIIFLTYPENWPSEGLPWSAMAIALIAFGPGRIALDYLLVRHLRR
jgi:putative oxidoreductase